MDWLNKMEKLYVQINGERMEATGEDLEEILELKAKRETEEIARLKAASDKMAILAKIGLTADEAKLLLS